MKSSLLKAILRTAALVGVGALTTAGSSPAVTVDVYLRAQSFSKPLPAPAPSVPMWGFALCTDDTFGSCSDPSVPGPQIEVNELDTLNIHVANDLPTPVSILIPGQAGGGDPTWTSDALGRTRVQSLSHETAPGGTGVYTWSSLRPGTYLYESGTHPSIQVPMGLYGALVVHGPGHTTASPVAYTGVGYDAGALLLFSEIDPVQNAAVGALTESMIPASYPKTIDYKPMYFLINGEPYDRTTPPAEVLAGEPGDIVLLRFLNAGLRSHAPAVVGLEMGLVAEDGNPYPGLRKVQAAALLAAGKTLDVLVAMPASDATYPLFDRMLDLTNDNLPDGGMLAYLKVGAGSPPSEPPASSAVNDIYAVIEDTPLAVPAPGVLANDVGLSGATMVSGPSNGMLVLNSDGSFQYTPNENFSGSDAFTYSASDGTNSYAALVTLDLSFVNDPPVAAADSYVNAIGPSITVAAPGVLGNDADPDGDPLTAVLDSGAVTLNPNGSFTYSGGSTTFTYHATDGVVSSAPVTVTLTVHPVASIALSVQDPLGAPVTSYRWLVQEDATYHVDPDAPGLPMDSLSTNFHRSYMPVVAQGCVGAECNSANESVPLAAFNLVALDPSKHYYVSVLPNDAGSGTGHSIGGAQIPPGTTAVTVIVNNQPIPTAQIAVFAFEDIVPTNGAPDPAEPGLGGFEIILEDAAGRYGQAGGMMSQDAYGMPLRNSLDCFGGAPPSAGVILTCPDGTALIKDLPPGKYGVIVVPPAGSGPWTQTSTIEGTKVQDNWVKAGEPPFLVEFGAPGFHAFIGFVNPEHTTVPPGPPGQQMNTITGSVTLAHTDRAPSQVAWDSGNYDAFAHTRAWIGLNSNAGFGPNIATVHAEPDGSFRIEGIPDGTYQLAIWDDYLDQIIAYRTVTLPGGGNAGHIPVNAWFGRHEHNVFLDLDENGVRDEGEEGLPDQNVNLRFRDGTVFQSFPTDTEGFVPFDQVFPFGAWQIAEIDFLRFKPTGVTVTVDGGGDVSGGPYPGLLNPQVGSPRTDTENPPVLLEGFQSMPGMTSIFEWGKAPYQPGENGGIAGIVFYASTRGENDPRLTVGDPWEPGVALVKVRLYREVATSTGGTALALVKEVMTDSWDASVPTGCLGEITPNPFVDVTLDGDETRCFDGIRNFEQVRPGVVFDGGYAFTGIPPGAYVVEVVPPPGYELYKEEDKNVDFGDSFVTPVPLMLPGGASVVIMPDQAMVAAVKGPEPGLAQPPCVGPLHTVPAQLSLFPGVYGVDTYAPFAGAERPLCNRKRVVLSDQGQAAADFFLFTSTPAAGQFQGLMTDDIAIETNQLSPQFGDKWGPAFIPFTMRDFKGQVVYRGYSDAFGLYNGVIPSTFSAHIPVPSGYSPAMHTVCLNDPQAFPGPGGTPDPRRNPAYGTFCYTLMFMPATTTYLDTPMLPQAAFAADFNPVDCAFSDGTPVVKSVGALDTDNGTLVAPGAILTIHSQGPTQVPNPAYEGPTAPDAPPWNQPMITRDYGFGASQGVGGVTLNGTPLTDVTWTDATITGTVPAGTPTGSYQLAVTRDNGKSSVNAVTVTVDPGLTPLRVGPGQAYTTIQDAIDAAAPGALILVDPGVYEELVIMWKPVRLQGAGAATVINAVKFPTEKLQAWRLKVEDLLATGQVDLLPGQPAEFNLVAGGLFGTELGPGIIVLAKNDTSFENNPSRIDGFTISRADGGGGIFVNGYAHGLGISNNNVTGNSGVIHGGIRVGHPALAPAGNGPFGYNRNLNIHHNAITLNGGQSARGAGGGLSLCTGTDTYTVSRNFICGNFTVGEGGGIGHLGLSTPGLIEFNQVLFNQSFNQGLDRSGGGILIAGEPPAAGVLTLGAGNVTLDANLIQGNQAATGHGGGVRTQYVNGRDVQLSPNQPNNWYQLRLTNNMIVNNVAGWSGAGISLKDTVNGSIVLNTISRNDSTATVGAVINNVTGTSTRQPAGISSERNSLALDAVIPGTQQSRRNFSNPELTHNVIWQNRAFTYDANGGAARLLPVLTPDAVGGCPAGADYFDLGVLDPGFNLNPQFSILTGGTGNNISADPLFLMGYCNGARILRTPGPMSVASEAAEGGNSSDVRFGPLTQAWPVGSSPWNYHIANDSPAIDLPGVQPSGVSHDFDDQLRPQGPRVDVGADEVGSGPPEPTPGTVTFSSGDFGNVPVGSTAMLTITATVSVAPVTFASSTSPAAPFAKTGETCSGTTRGVGETCTFAVTYTPTVSEPPGNFNTGSFLVTHDGTGSPQTVNLTGTGVAPGVVEIASASFGSLDEDLLDFGTLPNGSYSSIVTLSISGAFPVTFGTLTYSGSGSFSISADHCSGMTVDPAGTCDFTVNFDGRGNNSKTGTVSFHHNGAGFQALTVTGR